MENYGYEKPVSELLYLGKKRLDEDRSYIDEYNFTPEHIPELIRLFKEETFLDPDYWEKPEGWSFAHVLTVLGQLKDKSTLPFLFEIAETEEDSDWIWEELPAIISMFGKDILPDIKSSLRRVYDNHITNTTILNISGELAKREPEIKQDIFDFWVELLTDYKKNDFGFNAQIIHHFTEHKYQPALPLIEKAFKARRVDEFYAGDYEDALVKYGLKEEDPNREKDYFGPSGELFKRMRESLEAIQNSHAEIDENADEDNNPFEIMDSSNATKRKISKSKKKSKRKQAKKSRKNNRKK